MEKQRVLAIVGPTASGKTALAIALAQKLGGEIISCDSMQIYRTMDIGTAKATPEEQRAVPHHLIDVAEPDELFSCQDYAALAREAVREIASRGKLPIFCGGTGLYLDSAVRIDKMADTGRDDAIRAELVAFLEEHGAHALWELLSEVDPEAAEATHENNTRRVVRALEIYRATGIPKTEWDRRSKTDESAYDLTVIALTAEDRSLLHARIDRRVDQMLEAGLLAEARDLFSRIPPEKTTASQAIGYKELLSVLRGERTLEEAAEDIKTATRRYAKRQLT